MYIIQIFFVLIKPFNNDTKHMQGCIGELLDKDLLADFITNFSHVKEMFCFATVFVDYFFSFNVVSFQDIVIYDSPQYLFFFLWISELPCILGKDNRLIVTLLSPQCGIQISPSPRLGHTLAWNQPFTNLLLPEKWHK